MCRSEASAMGFRGGGGKRGWWIAFEAMMSITKKRAGDRGREGGRVGVP